MKNNSLTFSELEKIIKIKNTKNVDKNGKYTFFKILKSMEEDSEDVLYFPIYLKESDDQGGWYPKDSDTRRKINEYVIDHPDYTYILDEETYEKLDNKELKIIIVPNIMESIDELFNYFMNNRDFKTILVTGSVGKTTTVGLIKDVIKDNVLRIYTKRITPIILKTNVINYLTNDIDYLVLEAAFYYRHHVKYFSETLKPSISVCLNILPEHIGVDGVSNVEEITKCKLQVFKYSKVALINSQDKELKKIKFKDNKIIYNDFEMSSNVEKVYDIYDFNPKIDLYIKTYLSKLQYSSAYCVGKVLNIPEKSILERLNHSVPVEHRVNKNVLFDKNIIFDGDVSGVARFSLFTNHFYDRAVLIIRSLTTNGEEEEDYSQLPKYFNRFETVYLFNDLVDLDALKADNVKIVSDHNFIKQIDDDVQIFYHYGSFYRKFSEFNLENLR